MVFSIVLIIAILLIIVILIVIGSSIKFYGDKGEKDVIKNIYIYLVLFATLMMTIGGSVGVFMAAADLIAPSPYYQTFEEYKQWQYSDEEKGGQQNLTEEQLRSSYEAMIAAEKEREIARAKNSLIKSFGWIVIPLPVFLYYQKRLRQKNDL